MTSMHQVRRVGGVAMFAGCVGLAGCVGNSYTDEGRNQAEIRYSTIKSATEWDMAHQAFLAGDLRRALDGVDRSIAMNEEVPKSHVLRGRVLLEMSRLDESLDALHRAEEIDAEYVDAQYYLGVVYERLMERDLALDHYTRAADLNPEAAQYVVAVAEVMIDQGNAIEAREYIESRRARFDHNPGVRQTLGHIALIDGDHLRALTMFNEARLLAPDDNDILEDLARTQVALERYGEAEVNLGKLLRSPSVAEQRRDLRHMRSRCLVETGRYVDARNEYLALTGDEEHGPADLEAWIGLGNVAAILKDPQRHRLAANRAMALAPTREDGYLLRAVWHRRRGENDEAVFWLDKAIERVPQPTNSHVLRGVILSDLGRRDEARESIAAAYRADPSDATIAGLLDSFDD